MKKEKLRNSGTMTEAAFFSMIRSALRQKSRFWKPRLEVLNKVKRPYVGPNKRLKYEYKCSICNDYHPQKEVEVDHIIPAGSLKSFNDLPLFVERLFCESDGLRVLCKKCHNKITHNKD